MRELNQLLLNFDVKRSFNNYDFFVTENNYFAYSLIDKWPRWEKEILNISGETFSGKTHLANIFKSKTSALFLKEEEIKNDVLKEIKLYESVIVDNFSNEIDENLMYSLFNLIDQDSKYLLINSEIPLNEINFRLPDLVSRSKNLLHAKINSPDDELIFAIILKNFSDRQIYLEKKIIEFIINRIERSYRKISEFIYKIDEISLKKKKPINLKTIKEIL